MNRNLVNKKGFLFTITTMLLFLSIFTLTSVYLDRNKDLQYSITRSGAGDKLRYIEDDVVSNIYSELLDLRLNGITHPSKSSNINISFNQVIFVPGRDYGAIMSAYESFIEGTYSTKNNVQVELHGFSNNFTIEPYDSLFEINGDNIYAYTLPLIYRANYIESITVTVKVNAQNNSLCTAPDDDHAQYPLITVTFVYNIAGGGQGSCTNSVQLNPGENNNKAGYQFYMKTASPSGSIEVEYGQLAGREGIFTIDASGISANVTQLDIEYEPKEDEVVIIKGGVISMSTPIGNIIKKSDIVLAGE